MIELSAQFGHQSVSVAQVTSLAGVSSATFYAQFDDKEACVAEALASAARRVLGEARVPAGGAADWHQQALRTVRRLLSALQENPSAGRMLFVETLSGGPRVNATRIRALGDFERRVQAMLDSTPADADSLDVPATAIVGAARSIVARSLRTHGENELPANGRRSPSAWVLSYARPAGEELLEYRARRSLLPALSTSRAKRARRTLGGRAFSACPGGRHGLPPGADRSQPPHAHPLRQRPRR